MFFGGNAILEKVVPIEVGYIEDPRNEGTETLQTIPLGGLLLCYIEDPRNEGTETYGRDSCNSPFFTCYIEDPRSKQTEMAGAYRRVRTLVWLH